MTTPTITKDELLGNMRATGGQFVEAVRAVPEGRYEEAWTYLEDPRGAGQ
jgi:hypothetical protein